jgi:hypothetical protein
MRRSLVREQTRKLPIPYFVMLNEAKHLNRSFWLGETGMGSLSLSAAPGHEE